ncbi:MAG: DUF262 domain-containing protein [Anaerolineales bacterium]|nr:DUF262 domain-containing protein [Anaerolineales bacterium]
MKNFDTRVYSIADLVEWSNNDLLNLSPDFQRRTVWSEKAKSYLIDTLIRGKPIPKILITQELRGSRNVRVVVDGQQRIRAILGFINNDFKISRAHSKEYAGLTFNLLPPEVQNDLLKYELGVDLLFDLSYEDILDIFTRINAYTVSLNSQEKFNAKYLGYFKQIVYKYGFRYVSYFIEAGVLTKAAVTRMAEAELSADLFTALVDGVQTNKNVEQYYRKYEDDLADLEMMGERFDEIMSYIGAIYSPEDLSNTNWSRIQLFYTLFTSLGHLLYSLNRLDPKLRVHIDKNSVGKIRVKLDEISSRFDQVAANLDDPTSPSDYRAFIERSRRGTTDTGARIARSNFVCAKLVEALS